MNIVTESDVWLLMWSAIIIAVAARFILMLVDVIRGRRVD